jgi:hypothetical protein
VTREHVSGDPCAGRCSVRWRCGRAQDLIKKITLKDTLQSFNTCDLKKGFMRDSLNPVDEPSPINLAVSEFLSRTERVVNLRLSTVMI